MRHSSLLGWVLLSAIILRAWTLSISGGSDGRHAVRRRRRRTVVNSFHLGQRAGDELTADYVIIGAGTAGSLLADRLSKQGTVLLIECGDELPNGVRARLPGAKCTFDTLEINERHRCGERCFEEFSGLSERGARDENGLKLRQGPGGTSVLAVGAHFRGGKAFWKKIAASHGGHWMLPESDIARLEQEMSVRRKPAAVDRDHLLFARAAVALVHLPTNMTRGVPKVFPRYQDRSGWSVNAYSQFLKKALRRPGVRMLKRTCAKRLVLQQDGAPLVELRQSSKRASRHVRAQREVILAAGAVGSAALLQMSGITPAALRDQADVRVAWQCMGCQYIHEFIRELPKLFRGERVAARPPATLTLPGFDSGIMVDLDGSPALVLASTEYYLEKGTVLEVHIVLLQPRMFEGKVTAEGRLERALQLTDPADVAAAVRGIRLVRGAVARSSLAAKLRLGQEIYPGAQSKTDSEIAAVLQSNGGVWSFQSATGSCRLGQIVDGKLRVRGTNGLRVADASVLPHPPLGRTLFPTLVVAEVASRLISHNASQMH